MIYIDETHLKLTKRVAQAFKPQNLFQNYLKKAQMMIDLGVNRIKM